MINSRLKIFANYLRVHRQKLRRQKKLSNYDEDTREIILKVHDHTMISFNELFSFIEAVRYVNRWQIPGAIVECGVWRGGAIMAAALTLKHLGVTDRTFYLYDTFCGMPAPSEYDSRLGGSVNPQEKFCLLQTGPDSSDWCRASLDEVRQNLATTRYDFNRFKFVEGKVEETIPGTLPDEIAILRLDTDWYESTKHEMIHLFPRLVSKGVLIVDDYHTWSGSKKAVDEFLAAANVSGFHLKLAAASVPDFHLKEGEFIGIKP